jgi:hypothetical protein
MHAQRAAIAKPVRNSRCSIWSTARRISPSACPCPLTGARNVERPDDRAARIEDRRRGAAQHRMSAKKCSPPCTAIGRRSAMAVPIALVPVLAGPGHAGPQHLRRPRQEAGVADGVEDHAVGIRQDTTLPVSRASPASISSSGRQRRRSDSRAGAAHGVRPRSAARHRAAALASPCRCSAAGSAAPAGARFERQLPSPK